MKILGLRAVGWRNLSPLELVFDPAARLIVLFGDNGQGKTNALEALYYLAALRSFRTAQVSDLVRHGATDVLLAALVERQGLERRIEIRLGATETRAVGRSVTIDGKHARSPKAALGTVSVVLFVPEDLLLPRGAPAARRRFLDMAVFGVEPAYLGEAAAFQKTLRSRNALLRRPGAVRPLSPALLETYDEELAKAGARVVMRRRRIVAALQPHARRYFRALHAELPLDLEYVSDPRVVAAGDEPAVTEALLAGFRDRRSVDERRGHTTLGPQADDLEIRLSGRPARTHASQGQLRSLVLALKLGEMAHIEAAVGDTPALLLDDVPSELDPDRRRYLFETLADLRCQTLITVADRSLIPALPERADFSVKAGVITAVGETGISALQTQV